MSLTEKIEDKLSTDIKNHPIEAALLVFYLPILHNQIGYLLSSFPIDDRAFWFLNTETASVWVVEAAALFLCVRRESTKKKNRRLILAALLYLVSSQLYAFAGFVLGYSNCYHLAGFQVLLLKFAHVVNLLYPVVILFNRMHKTSAPKSSHKNLEKCDGRGENQKRNCTAEINDEDNSNYLIIGFLLTLVPISAFLSLTLDCLFFSTCRYSACLVNVIHSLVNGFVGIAWCVICLSAAFLFLCALLFVIRNED